MEHGRRWTSLHAATTGATPSNGGTSRKVVPEMSCTFWPFANATLRQSEQGERAAQRCRCRCADGCRRRIRLAISRRALYTSAIHVSFPTFKPRQSDLRLCSLFKELKPWKLSEQSSCRVAERVDARASAVRWACPPRLLDAASTSAWRLASFDERQVAIVPFQIINNIYCQQTLRIQFRSSALLSVRDRGREELQSMFIHSSFKDLQPLPLSLQVHRCTSFKSKNSVGW